MRFAYFHEDHYCQIELLPLSAAEWCSAQMGEIEQFSSLHKSEEGFTDIYLRPDAPDSLKQLAISRTEMVRLKAILPEYDEVQTGYGDYRKECRHTMAWGNDDFIIFVDYDEEGIAEHIWFTIRLFEIEHIAQIQSFFKAIPRSNELLVVDWNWKHFARLSDDAAMIEYLNGYVQPGFPSS